MVIHNLLTFLPISIPTNTREDIIYIFCINKDADFFTLPTRNVNVEIFGIVIN